MSSSALATPMMRQYLAIKAEHPDAILFYRMGDFYEMFLRDAELAAPLLDIALTTRDKGKPDAVPMCGIPVHSADGYVKRLVEQGHRVAICEQVEAAGTGGARRLVRREVVEVVTPGLAGDPEALDASRAVTLAALSQPGVGESGRSAGFGLAALDASSGDLRATAEPGAALPESLLQELERVAPRELLLPDGAPAELLAALSERLPGIALTLAPLESFEAARAPAHPDGLDPGARDAASSAAAGLLAYVARHQPFALRQVARLRRYRLAEVLVMDAAARTHLELFESLEDRSRRGTLLERLDETVTAPGARRLARWLAYPLADPGAIAARQEAVAWLVERDRPRARLREALRGVRDLERVLAKAARPGAGPRELVALRRSLEALPGVAEALEAGDPEELRLPGGAGTRPASLPRPEPLPEAVRLVADALVDDPPPLPRGSRGAGETGFVREGYVAELDALRESARKGREWIAGLEARERSRTGIASLRIRFHPVHGYGIEVTKSNLGRVPDGFERKQTLANAERFTPPELREMERSILGASERAAALEREVFESVRQAVLELSPTIQRAAEAAAELDALASLAEVARRDGWTRPLVDDGERLEIAAGRHPVVERMLQMAGGEFVPNDAELDPEGPQLLLLTGPNMSGKSTYLRQVALLAVLAQMGSCVPAEHMRLGVVDRLFTRVGASDRLARGESTFMVEMRETAAILAQASRSSLVILDEIGRGTSTYDGLSVAWAVAEYLHDTPGLRPRTLFATHYHELTELEGTLPRLRNGHFEVREWGHELIFLRRLAAGGASRSYGIDVARLAGLPPRVVERAREVLRRLEEEARDAAGRPRLAGPAAPAAAEPELPLFAPRSAAATEAEREALRVLRETDPERTTPLDALVLLQRLVRSLCEEDAQ